MEKNLKILPGTTYFCVKFDFDIDLCWVPGDTYILSDAISRLPFLT